MKLIAHLSDLHFGRVDPAIPPALIAALAQARPDLVVVSGDLTQRARTAEFRAAAGLLALLPFPQLIVPGNHDVPLHNPIARWLRPFTRYRQFITDDLEPYCANGEIAVLGINTARANTLKNGRINAGQLTRSCARFAALTPGIVRIVVTHHPFDFDVTGGQADLVKRADAAMTAFATAGVDLILSGHLHGSSVGDSVRRYGIAHRPVLLVQAGTATSTRRRGEDNSFNYLRVEAGRIGIDSMAWNKTRQCFTLARTEQFVRSGESWLRDGEHRT